MGEFIKDLSLVSKGMRYKLLIAFSLMSVIPLLICIYLASIYIFPTLSSLGDISVVLVIAIFIALLGLVLAKSLIEPVIKLAVDARTIANGDMSKTIDLRRDDEIGVLADSINHMTKRIRDNIDELKGYGERTKQINVEIHRKVIVLSGILQIGNLISQSVDLKEILGFIIERMADLPGTERVFLFLRDESEDVLVMGPNVNVTSEKALYKRIAVDRSFMGQIIARKMPYIIDKDSKPDPALEEFKKEFEVSNAIILPMIYQSKIIGMLGIGNTKPDFKFHEDEIELFNIFAKQIVIAVENDTLSKMAKGLAVKDELTGLYNESYIKARLDEEIKRSIVYQRPCAFLIYDIDDFKAFREKYGEILAEKALKKVGFVLESNITQIDRIARSGDDQFAIVLPEKNKRQAGEIAEILRIKVSESLFEFEPSKSTARITVSGAVSENPIDGSSANDLIARATALLSQAKAQGKNRIAL